MEENSSEFQGVLQEELKERILRHKSIVIMGALIDEDLQDIYDNELLKVYKDMPVTFIKGHEDRFNYIQTKALLVEEDLEKRAERGDTEPFDKVYELCWKLTNHRKYLDTDTPEQWDSEDNEEENN